MRSYPFAGLVLLTLVIITYFYGSLLLSPNQHLFGAENDALKSYYATAYHIKNDSSYLNFQGMNYPYGENILYTDCQPVLANSLKILGTFHPFFIQHSIGILNLLMILGLFACSLVLYFLLKKLGIRPWFSVLFALAITLLAPQLFRMEGHYGLSYSMAIPLSWLLLLICRKATSNWWSFLLLFISNLFWLFVHAYLGVIVIFFTIVLLAIDWLQKRRENIDWKNEIKLASTVLLPILFFFVFIKTTDHHVRRTDNIGGFFLYNAELDDVFIPHHGPVRILLDKALGEGVIGQKWEARAYVGLPTTLLFAGLLIWFLLGLFRKKQAPLLLHFFSNRQINRAFLAATLVLLFSFGIPFVQFPSLLDHFAILKQFRATGRFAWPFYFASLVLTAFVFQEIYTQLKERRHPQLANLLLLLVLTIYLVEGISHHQVVAKKISQFPNTFNEDLLPQKYKDLLEHYQATDYQAILPLPFYHYGSESYWRPRKAPIVETSILLSYYSGLPIFGAALTRTSIPESKNIVQIISADFYDKQIQQDIQSDLPILVVTANLPLSKYEQDILDKSKLIHTAEDKSIYALYPKDLFRNSASERFKTFTEKQSDLKARQGLLTPDSTSFLYYHNFEDQPSPIAFRGSGAYQAMKKGRNVLDQFAPGTFSSGQTYHFSIWMHNGEPDALNHFFQLFIEEHLPENQQVLKTVLFPEQAETIYGNWSLVEGTFHVQNPANTVVIATKGNRLSKAHLYADDLLIRVAGEDIYQLDKTGTVLFYNNHEVKLK